MTTIAANHKVIAADSMATTGDVKTSVPKLFTINGWFIGVAGEYSDGLEILYDIRRSKESPVHYLTTRDARKKGVTFLILSPSGEVYESEDACTPMRLTEGFGAIGTGAQGAMALLHAGHDPVETVRIMTKVDPSTGGKVQKRKI